MIYRFRFGGMGIAAALLALVVSGCSDSPAESPNVEDDTFVGADGVAIDAHDASRIVTLSGDLTEFVFELGLGSSVVATDVTTVAPEEAVMLPKVGIGRFLTAEGVLKHNPTLVIGDTQTAPATAIEQIRAAGVPVAIVDVPTTFDGLYEKVTLLGILLDTPTTAGALNDRLQKEIASASVGSGDSSTTRRIAYVYTRGPDVMLLFGEGMTTTPVIEAAGGLDAGVEAGVEGNVPVTPEALAAAAHLATFRHTIYPWKSTEWSTSTIRLARDLKRRQAKSLWKQIWTVARQRQQKRLPLMTVRRLFPKQYRQQMLLLFRELTRQQEESIQPLLPRPNNRSWQVASGTKENVRFGRSEPA